MKVSLASSMAFAFLLTAFGGKALAMGQRAQVFEKPTEAGIWDHGNEFYLRMDLAEIAELKDQKFVWAGFHFDGKSGFTGEVVTNNFDQSERRFPARAKLLTSTPSGRYYLIEVLNEQGEVIKEMFVKGPASSLPER